MKPRQIIGLAAIVVFGGIVIYTLLKPKPDPFTVPGAIPMNDSIDTVTPPPPPPIPAPDSSAPPASPLNVGSQDARDDLYCSGLIYAARQAQASVTSPETQKANERMLALAEAGVARLMAEGVATPATTGGIADAHAEKAAADRGAGTPRIAEADCVARADAQLAKAPPT